MAITKLYLLNAPLDKEYKHTLYFQTETEQYNYFYGKRIKEYTDFTYQRKDGVVRVSHHFDDIQNCNYVMYQNTQTSNKWYYAFITDMKYVNDERTDITIETDAIQTYLFNVNIGQCFVEREHVSDDTIGLHTVPEGLELGDYVINNKNVNASLKTFSFIVACTVDLNNNFANVSGGMYQGIYSGVKYYKMTPSEINKCIKALADGGKSDAITSIFVCPSLFVSSLYPTDNPNGYAEVELNTSVIKKNWVNTLGVDETNIYKPSKIDGYTPVNNKLLTYPYCYMLMSNNSGGNAVYKYEMFNNPDDANLCDFWIYSTVTPGMSIRLVPLYYNGVGANHDEGIPLGKFPICNWNTDVYTNWLTQNSVNIGISVASSALQIVGGATLTATGGGAMVGASGITSGLLGVASAVGEVYSHSLQPPQAEGNLNCGDVVFSSGNLTFTALQMTIKKEYAKIIDNYFNMFGYKVNTVKVPNKNHRKYYWYTKTIDANISGDIPLTDLNKIKECYNRGITFWKNANYMYQYDLTNGTV